MVSCWKIESICAGGRGLRVSTHQILGSSFLKAVRLAKDDLSGTKNEYELVIADTGTNPVQTKAAIQKLIGVDKVEAIVGGISLPGQVVKPYAAYAKIPHLCVCSVSSIGDGEFNFTNIPLPEDEAVRWVEEARKRGIKTVALLTQDYPSIDGHVRALKEELTRGGIEIASTNRIRRNHDRFPGHRGRCENLGSRRVFH
jgi:ABC-type branched-subunit amino acid transport system substrate-binding protein